MSIVVLGAGVAGLTTALQLLRAGHSKVTVIARDLPSDYAPHYTSPWAGVNFVPVSEEGTVLQSWEIQTWEVLCKLAQVPAAGVWMQKKTSYFRYCDVPEGDFNPWYRHMMPEYRVLSKSEVPPFADWAIQYRTAALDPSLYLHYLQAQCLELGAQFHRRAITHIREAFSLETEACHADLVINCSGLGASTLGGVDDQTVTPMQGQLVVVANESGGMFSLSGAEDMEPEKGDDCYIINRPAGGGTALGGCSRPTSVTVPDVELSRRIMRWAVRVCPQLVPPGAGIEALQVVRHQVGLRPVRVDGPRLESETIHDHELGQLQVVHNYGAAGFGYQASYGMANAAVRLAQESFSRTQRETS